MKEKEILVFGNENFTLGFELIGLSNIHRPENPEEQVRDFMESDEIGIVITEESLIRKIDSKLYNKVKNNVDPVFVLLSEDQSHQELNQKIKRAIGADISV